MSSRTVPVTIMAIFAVAIWFVVSSCSLEETAGYIAGDYCVEEGMKVCDDTFTVVLLCVSDGASLFWQPDEECAKGCTMDSGIGACIDASPTDKDQTDNDSPTLPETDPAVTDDATTMPETETVAGDDATVETEDEIVLDEDVVVQDDGTVTDDGTINDDGILTDDGGVTDDGTVTDDGVVTDDSTVTDEDGLITDTDNAPVTCTNITLPGTLDNDGSNGFFADYTPNTGNVALPDQFQFTIYDENYLFDTPYALGVGDNANLKTCKYYVFVGEDWSGSAWGKRFLAETGTVTLTEDSGGCSGGDVYAEFDNVTLREITVDGDGNSTFVPNGACLTLPAHVEMLLTPA